MMGTLFLNNLNEKRPTCNSWKELITKNRSKLTSKYTGLFYVNIL